MRAAAKPGLKAEPVAEDGKAGARASATTMVVTNNISNRGTLSRHPPGSSNTGSISYPHGSDSSHNSHPHGSSSSGDIHSYSSGDRGISRRPPDPGPTRRDHLLVSSSTPGPAGRGHLPYSSTVAEGPTHGDDIIGEAISRTGSRSCVSDAVRRSISLQTAGQLRPHPCPASSVRGITVFRSLGRAVRHLPPSPLDITRQRWTFDHFKLRASAATRQLRTCLADATIAQICQTNSTNSTSVGASLGIRLELLLRKIPGATGTIRAFRRVFEHWSAEKGGVGSSYLPSAFVGQRVGIDQVDDVWIGDSGTTTHMSRNVDLIYDTRPPSPHRSRIILGDSSIKKVHFVGKLDLVFHSSTNHPVTLHDVSFVPDLGFNLFSFHVVQEKHEIILNRTGAHLLGGRLVFPRRSNGSSLRVTRVLPGRHANENTALTTFANPPSQRNDGPPSPVLYSSVASPVAHQKSGVSRSCRTSNAGARSGVKIPSIVQEQSGESESGSAGMATAVLSPGGVFVNKKKKGVRY